MAVAEALVDKDIAVLDNTGKAAPGLGAYGGVSAQDLLGGGRAASSSSPLATLPAESTKGVGVAKPAPTTTGIRGFIDRLAHVRERMDLPSPGSFEGLHREVRGEQTRYMLCSIDCLILICLYEIETRWRHVRSI